MFTNGNVMGVAKAALEATVRYLASELGRQHSRQRDFRRAYQDARCIRQHLGLFSRSSSISRPRAAQRTIDTSEVADAALPSPQQRRPRGYGRCLMVDAGYHAIGI